MRFTALIIATVAACHGRDSGHSDVSQMDPDHAFWKWFGDEAPSLSTNSLTDAMQRVQRELDKQHHGVFAEVGSDGTVRALVLTADGNRNAFPAIQLLFAARPNIVGWKIVAFRQRETKPFSKISIDKRDLEPATLRYVPHRNNDKLDIKLYVPGYRDDDKSLAQMAFLALDHTLGEYDVESKLAGIELLQLTEAPSISRPLEELPREIDELH